MAIHSISFLLSHPKIRFDKFLKKLIASVTAKPVIKASINGNFAIPVVSFWFPNNELSKRTTKKTPRIKAKIGGKKYQGHQILKLNLIV